MELNLFLHTYKRLKQYTFLINTLFILSIFFQIKIEFMNN
jgi:hypothetical protein